MSKKRGEQFGLVQARSAPLVSSLSLVSRGLEDLAFIRSAAESGGDDGAYHYALGENFYKDGEFDRAEEAFREAIRLSPNNSWYYRSLGRALSGQERYSEAEAANRRAISLDPNVAVYYNNLGIDLENQKRDEEAWEAYQTSLNLDPFVPRTHRNIGYFHLRRRDYEQAEASAHEAIRLEIDNPENYDLLREALQAQGKNPFEDATWKKVFEQTEFLQALVDIGGYYYEGGIRNFSKWSEAIHSYLEAEVGDGEDEPWPEFWPALKECIEKLLPQVWNQLINDPRLKASE